MGENRVSISLEGQITALDLEEHQVQLERGFGQSQRELQERHVRQNVKKSEESLCHATFQVVGQNEAESLEKPVRTWASETSSVTSAANAPENSPGNVGDYCSACRHRRKKFECYVFLTKFLGMRTFDMVITVPTVMFGNKTKIAGVPHCTRNQSRQLD